MGQEHGEAISGEEAYEILAELSAYIPPCPECGIKGCGPWVKYFMFWSTQTVVDPEGPLALFLALVNRSSGEIIVRTDELTQVRGNKVVLCQRALDEEGQPLYKLTLLNKADVTTDFQRRDKGDVDTEWPDLIG